MQDRIRQLAIEKLRNGEPLPLEFREHLFPTQNECELAYKGKLTEEQILAETMSVPLQRVTTTGSGNSDWTNKLIFGDNLQAMRSLLDDKQRGQLTNSDGTPGVRLVYIDPPFATQRDFTGTKNEPAYQDKVNGAKFIDFLRRRLVLIRQLLSDDGSLYIHLDEKKSHYAKVILDEIFGENNFQREIIWRIGWVSGYKTAAKNWIRNHDVLLFYTRHSNFLFNKTHIPYPKDYVRRDGKKPTGVGHPLEDTWNASELDQLPSIQIMSFSGEKTGFPTQKNENLLARIIAASSNPGDIVLDAFCGSGTTCAVAEKMGRRWIGIDSGKLAVYQTQKRLLNLRADIGNTGKQLTPASFTVYNAGLYDFSTLSELPWDNWLFFALQLFGCKPSPHSVGGVELHGRRHGDSVMIFNHLKTPGARITEETVFSLHAVLKGRVGKRFYIIAPRSVFDFQQDYIDLDSTRYYALRIPYSYINELHSRHFTSLLQPHEEGGLNAAVDAIGFDFITPPSADWKVSYQTDSEGVDYCTLQLVNFQSRGRIRGVLEPQPAFATLSMIMLDLSFEGDVFQPDRVLFSKELAASGYAVQIKASEITGRVMIVSLDIYGNEAREVFAQDQLVVQKSATKALSVASKKTPSKKKASKKTRNSAG